MSDSDKKLLIATAIVILTVILMILFAWNKDLQARRTDIHRAVKEGNLSRIKSILAERPELINARDKLLGGTPLHTAARCKDKEIIELLIANDADPNAKNKYGKTPLCDAVVFGSKEAVETLIALGANVNTKDGDDSTPLHWAVANGRKDCVEILIAHGTDVNAMNKTWSVLHEAAFHGDKNIVELLVANGAEVNAKDKSGMTPLQVSIRYNHKEVADLLRSHGAVE